MIYLLSSLSMVLPLCRYIFQPELRPIARSPEGLTRKRQNCESGFQVSSSVLLLVG